MRQGWWSVALGLTAGALLSGAPPAAARDAKAAAKPSARLQSSALTDRRALRGTVRTLRAAPRAPVALGSAVWWGCVDQAFAGPGALACRKPYDPRYEQAARRFDHYVPENELKELWIHPRPGAWDFSVPDRMAAWAQDQGRQLRGHALIFGDATPLWKYAPLALWTRERLLADMRQHITTTMTHFARKFPGVIRDWDVVNEPFEDSGRRERNVYQQTIGDGYVDEAFRAARAADPSATLVLNEFNAERLGTPRSEALYELARDLVARGVPLDAIGLQMHLDTRELPTRADLDGQFARYAALGLDVQYTELDVQGTRRDARADPVGALARQEEVLRMVTGACAAAPNCTRVTSWGVADHHSWRGVDELATLLTKDFAVKPIFGEMRALLGR